MFVELRLRAVEIKDQQHWRWVLTGGSGAPLADYTVDLDPAAPEYPAFEDLHRYLRWHIDPDRRAMEEAEWVARVGAWTGAQVLGAEIGAHVVAAAPVTVRVVGPQFLLWRPLELAHVAGVPLASRGDVSLVYDVDTPGRDKPEVAEPLRMLAVFTLPTATTALGLRRERYELTRRVRRLAARRGRPVDLEVLQYGVTKQRLADRVAFRGGPDVLHISGHGEAGAVLLEGPDGSPDPVTAAQLLELLAPARSRVKLAVVSTCDSAAATIAETLSWLGEPEAAAQAHAQAAHVPPTDPGLARTFAQELDCAVVAMRYRVHDEFAIALADRLYENLFWLELPLDQALPRAVAAAAPAGPAISIATPALVGTRAVGLPLVPLPGEPVLRTSRMIGFLPEPERFVGRSRAMAEASAALASGSHRTGVLLHGMAGGGKTACALELAYRHEHAFADGLVFWQAPTREDEWQGALASLARALEQVGLAMVDKIGTPESFRAFLPVLSRLLADNGILLVLDNLETLLTPDGTWRDPRWAELIPALTDHDGESRVVLTSRTRPAGLDGRVLVEPIHALSRDESVLLARELPNLRRLLHADPSPLRRPGAAVEDDRATAHRVLHLVQGHPKLLELADAAAADPERLAIHLDAARQAARARGAALSAFFAHGESSLDADGFLDVLTSWTTSTLDTLPDDTRLLLQLVCLAEDTDRDSDLLGDNWAHLWRRLERPGDPPDPERLVQQLTTAALIHHHDTNQPVRYDIHPGIAEAVRATAPAELSTAVDTELATWWVSVFGHFLQREEGEHTQAVAYAGLAAAPYLLRRQQWHIAAELLHEATNRDRTPGTVQAALPHLRRIATATGDLSHARLLARIVARVEPGQAEPLLRQLVDQAAATHDYTTASAAGGNLVDLLRDTGRLSEALTVIDRMAEHTRVAGLGPWTQLADRSRRLQLLRRLGKPEQVLTEFDALRAEMDRLPAQPDPTETGIPWNVRETTFITGALAAKDLEQWQQALNLNAEVLTSVLRRGAGAHDIAQTRFNDYGPLLGLGHLDQADTLLRQCQQVFEDHQDIPSLGKVWIARAEVAARRGDHPSAVAFTRTALRLTYIQPDPRDAAVQHHNLAIYLVAAGADSTGRLAHRLAAAITFHLIDNERGRDDSIKALAGDLATLDQPPPLPGTLADLAAQVEQVEQVEGVHFAELIAALAPDPDTAQAALTEIIQAAQTPMEEDAA